MKSSFLVLISGEPSFTEELKKKLAEMYPDISIDTAVPGDESLKAALTGRYDAVVSCFKIPATLDSGLFSRFRSNGIGCSFIWPLMPAGSSFLSRQMLWQQGPVNL